MRSKNLILLCPVHRCAPEYKKHVYIEKGGIVCDYSGKVHEIQELADYCCYCKKCYDEYFIPSKYELDIPKNIGNTNRSKIIEKFGRGFTSQNSFNAAKNNWNNAVRRFKVTTMKKAIRGEDIDEIIFNNESELK